MIQVQTRDWYSFAFRQTFTPNDWAYVSLVKLPPHVRNPRANEGRVVWTLRVDSNDTGGSVNSSGRVVAALMEFIQSHTAAEVEREDSYDLRALREETDHTGVLEFVWPDFQHKRYVATPWLNGLTQ